MRTPLIALTLLAGCATQQEVCVARATSDLISIRSLIADTEATLDRGYGMAQITEPLSLTIPCPNDPDKICNRLDTKTRAFPYLIDPEVTRLRLQSLRTAEARATARALAAPQACLNGRAG